jgi:hypothetical protein
MEIATQTENWRDCPKGRGGLTKVDLDRTPVGNAAHEHERGEKHLWMSGRPLLLHNRQKILYTQNPLTVLMTI